MKWTLSCSGCGEAWEAEVDSARPYRCTICGLLEGWSQELDWPYILQLLGSVQRYFPGAPLAGKVARDPEHGTECFLLEVFTRFEPQEADGLDQELNEWRLSQGEPKQEMPLVIDVRILG